MNQFTVRLRASSETSPEFYIWATRCSIETILDQKRYCFYLGDGAPPIQMYLGSGSVAQWVVLFDGTEVREAAECQTQTV